MSLSHRRRPVAPKDRHHNLKEIGNFLGQTALSLFFLWLAYGALYGFIGFVKHAWEAQ